MTETLCPCGSGLDLTQCCQPIIDGNAPALTAEALMRSRYTAYTQGNAAYLHNTLATFQQDGDEPGEDDLADVNWTGLEIRSTEAGGPDDERGMVEFVAKYKVGKEIHVHHERSTFCRENGRWVYEDGINNPKSAPITSQKVGRNEPCPCGSGKKFKKCCGANA